MNDRALFMILKNTNDSFSVNFQMKNRSPM